MKNNLDLVKQKLSILIQEYKKYEDLSPPKPPPIGNVWSVSYGDLMLEENFTGWEGYDCLFVRKILIGVRIGTRFANYNTEINSNLKLKIKNVFKEFIANNSGYFLYNSYGGSYHVIGVFKD